MLKIILFVLLGCFHFGIFAQDLPAPAQNKDEFEKNYQWRIQQTNLAGVYIPKDLFDAIKQLNKLTDTTSRLKFKLLSENDAEHKLFFSLNRWIVTNWGLYEGSRLGDYLKDNKIYFPEDQATAVIISWHRTLNGKDINFREITSRLSEKRKKEKEERLKKVLKNAGTTITIKSKNDSAATKN